MATLIFFAIIFLAFFAGYLTGLSNKGITINHNHPEKIVEKAPETPVYNEVYLDGMDPEARAYLEKHNGQIKL